MRLRSLHTSYLDSKWLVALWREWLLAKSCLEKISRWEKGWYTNHPQLDRFKKYWMWVVMINDYLSRVRDEADNRWMKFNREKIIYGRPLEEMNKIPVNQLQIHYEFEHLQKKLEVRDRNKYISNIKWYVDTLKTNNIFYIVEWGIEEREKI